MEVVGDAPRSIGTLGSFFFLVLVFNLCEQGCEGRVILSGCEGILMILNGRRVTAVIQMSLVTAAR